MTKYFTIAEANSLLPLVRVDIEHLQRIKKELNQRFLSLQQLQINKDHHRGYQEADPFFEIECEIEFLQLEAHTHVTNIQRLGAELKDVEIGLVDFPALKGEIEVLLCWRLGEEQIAYFHSRDNGFMGRRPINEFE